MVTPDPETNKEPVITASPAKGKPVPPPPADVKAYEAVVANDELTACNT